MKLDVFFCFFFLVFFSSRRNYDCAEIEEEGKSRTIQLEIELRSSLSPYEALNICGYTRQLENNVYTRNYFIPIVHIYMYR